MDLLADETVLNCANDQMTRIYPDSTFEDYAGFGTSWTVNGQIITFTADTLAASQAGTYVFQQTWEGLGTCEISDSLIINIDTLSPEVTVTENLVFLTVIRIAF